MTRRNWRSWAASRLGVALLLTGGVALAQGPGKPDDPNALPQPQRGSGLASRALILEPAVQREVGLTPRQRETLDNIDVEAAQARQGAMVNQDEDGQEVPFDFNAMIGAAQGVERDRGKAINKVLTAAQRHRIAQLEWQREGWPALRRPDVANRIKLKPEQSLQIGAIVEKLQRDEARAVLDPSDPGDPATAAAAGPRKPRVDLNPRNGFIDPTGGGFADGGPLNFSTEGMAALEKRTTEAAARLRRAAAVEVDAILAPDQKAAFVRLLGPKFDFRALDEGSPVAPPAPAPGRKRTDRPSGTKNRK